MTTDFMKATAWKQRADAREAAREARRSDRREGLLESMCERIQAKIDEQKEGAIKVSFALCGDEDVPICEEIAERLREAGWSVDLKYVEGSMISFTRQAEHVTFTLTPEQGQ